MAGKMMVYSNNLNSADKDPDFSKRMGLPNLRANGAITLIVDARWLKAILKFKPSEMRDFQCFESYFWLLY